MKTSHALGLFSTASTGPRRAWRPPLPGSRMRSLGRAGLEQAAGPVDQEGHFHDGGISGLPGAASRGWSVGIVERKDENGRADGEHVGYGPRAKKTRITRKKQIYINERKERVSGIVSMTIDGEMPTSSPRRRGCFSGNTCELTMLTK